jgi:hypothetical protein
VQAAVTKLHHLQYSHFDQIAYTANAVAGLGEIVHWKNMLAAIRENGWLEKARTARGLVLLLHGVVMVGTYEKEEREVVSLILRRLNQLGEDRFDWEGFGFIGTLKVCLTLLNKEVGEDMRGSDARKIIEKVQGIELKQERVVSKIQNEIARVLENCGIRLWRFFITLCRL